VTFDVFREAATRGYLRNVAGSNNVGLVKVLEHRSFIANVDTALDHLSMAKHFSYSDVLQTHKTLFESVYPWAGEDRRKHAPDIAITRGGKAMFAYPQGVQGAMECGLRQG
jgi:cell filamentation protein